MVDKNHPKDSMISVTTNVPIVPKTRPTLKLKYGSNNNVPLQPKNRPLEPISNPKQPFDQKKFRVYRDSFISNRNNFAGGVFGVSLSESLSIASAEVIVQSEMVSFGRIPVVVAKCGAYLKQNGLKTRGIFRIAGNTKRIKELQYIFSKPPNYGSDFTQWDTYTVHDVASLLRRYLNNLEEPLIPLTSYDSFRAPLQNRPRILRHMQKRHKMSDAALNATTGSQTPQAPNFSSSEFNKRNQDNPQLSNHSKKLANQTRLPSELNDEIGNDGDEEGDDVVLEEKKRRRAIKKKKLSQDVKDTIEDYKILLATLSSDSKQLIIYLMDLLSLFARQSEFNLMSGRNLAAIFQPSILFHPQQDMNPKEYEISRLIIEFLIEYSYKLLPYLLKAVKQEQEEKHTKLLKETKGNCNSAIPRKYNNRSRDSLISRSVEEKENEQHIKLNNLSLHIDKNPSDNKKLQNIKTDFNPKPGQTIFVSNLPKTSSSLNNSARNSPLTPTDSLSRNEKRQNNITMANESSPILKKINFTNNLDVPNSSKNNLSPKMKYLRPHAKSIDSAYHPPDFIVSNKRRSKLFPWLHKPGILSDTGDLSVTEEEGEEELEGYDSEPFSPISNEKDLLKSSNPYSQNSNEEFSSTDNLTKKIFTGNRPKPNVIKPSCGTIESAVTTGVFNNSPTYDVDLVEQANQRSRSYSGTEEGEPDKKHTDALSHELLSPPEDKRKKRESWFQRLRSPTRALKK